MFDSTEGAYKFENTKSWTMISGHNVSDMELAAVAFSFYLDQLVISLINTIYFECECQEISN